MNNFFYAHLWPLNFKLFQAWYICYLCAKNAVKDPSTMSQ